MTGSLILSARSLFVIGLMLYSYELSALRISMYLEIDRFLECPSLLWLGTCIDMGASMPTAISISIYSKRKELVGIALGDG